MAVVNACDPCHYISIVDRPSGRINQAGSFGWIRGGYGSVKRLREAEVACLMADVCWLKANRRRLNPPAAFGFFELWYDRGLPGRTNLRRYPVRIFSILKNNVSGYRVLICRERCNGRLDSTGILFIKSEIFFSRAFISDSMAAMFLR